MFNPRATTRPIAGVLAFFTIVALATASAHAATIGGINVGDGNLDSVVSSLGLHTSFSFSNILGALIKFGGSYTIAHSVFELHDAWKQRQYRAQDFAHLLVGAGGTGVVVGGAALFISQFIGNGQGALLP
ncbi:hypothetical protein EPN42_01530 [bacterium]|nr:MAG: hypothetical protein EPN42_01530 [bacterium]